MARYFQLLLDDKLISPFVSEMIVNILSQQMVTNRFPALLPPETRMLHKTGNLDHVIHDVGVIWGKDGPVIVIAMVQGQSNDDRATAIVQRLALIAYGTFDVPPIPEGTPIPGDGTGMYEMALTPVATVTPGTDESSQSDPGE